MRRSLPKKGDVVDVYWTEERQWFVGKVVAVDEEELCFTILYEDEDELIVHSMEGDMRVRWRPVKDRLTKADMNLKFDRMRRSKSKLGKQLRRTLKAQSARPKEEIPDRNNDKSVVAAAESPETTENSDPAALSKDLATNDAPADAEVKNAAAHEGLATDVAAVDKSQNDGAADGADSAANSGDDGHCPNTPKSSSKSGEASSEASVDTAEQAERQEIVTTPPLGDVVVLPSPSSESDTTPSVSPTLAAERIAAARHLSGVMENIQRRKQQHSTMLMEASPVKRPRSFSEDDASMLVGDLDEATVEAAIAETLADTDAMLKQAHRQQSLENDVSAASPVSSPAGSSSAATDDSTPVGSGGQAALLPRSGDLSPETALVHRRLLFHSPGKKRSAPPSSDSPNKTARRKSPDMFVFRSPVGAKQFQHSFRTQRKHLEAVKAAQAQAVAAASDAALVTTSSPLKHQHALPANSGSMGAETTSTARSRQRARSSSFDSYHERPRRRQLALFSPQKGSRPPVDESMLPLKLQPSVSRGSDKFVEIPASQSPFKKKQPLTDSQIEKRESVAEQYRHFSSVGLSKLVPPSKKTDGDSTPSSPSLFRNDSIQESVMTPRTEEFRERLWGQ